MRQHQLAQVPLMRRAPGTFALITIPVTQQKTFKPMPRPAPIVHRVATRPTSRRRGTDRFIGRLGNVDSGQFTSARAAIRSRRLYFCMSHVCASLCECGSRAISNTCAGAQIARRFASSGSSMSLRIRFESTFSAIVEFAAGRVSPRWTAATCGLYFFPTVKPCTTHFLIAHFAHEDSLLSRY